MTDITTLKAQLDEAEEALDHAQAWRPVTVQPTSDPGYDVLRMAEQEASRLARVNAAAAKANAAAARLIAATR